MIYLGKLLKQDDIKVFTYNGTELIDVDYITYVIYDCTTGKQEVIRQTENSVPMRFDVGSYFVPLHLDPKIFRVGRHRVRWQVKQFSDSIMQQATDEFDIIRRPMYNGDFCKQPYMPSTDAGDVPNSTPGFNYNQSISGGTCAASTLTNQHS
jgi:hypothetical protein